jgi:hypothetical protein
MLRARKLASAALTASLVTLGGIGATVVSAGAAHAATCPAASRIVTDINVITSVAGGLNSRLGALTPNSRPGDVLAVAQSTAMDLNTMSRDFSADSTVLGGCPALGSSDSQTVASAFDSLAAATNQAINTLVRDHAIFAQYGVTAPVAGSLRTLEATLDSYTSALLAVAPSQQRAITDDQGSVDVSLGNAITVYEQICIPSPLYPTLQPICVTS